MEGYDVGIEVGAGLVITAPPVGAGVATNQSINARYPFWSSVNNKKSLLCYYKRENAKCNKNTKLNAFVCCCCVMSSI